MPVIERYSVDFERGDCAGGGSLALELVSTLQFKSGGALNLVDLYPPVPARLDVLGSAAVAFESNQTKSKKEIVTLSGGNRASLSFPRKWIDPCHLDSLGGTFGLVPAPIAGLSSGGSASIQALWAIDAETGSSIVPSVHFDADTNEIVTDKPVYGAFKVSYTASAHRYRVTRSGDNAFEDVTLHAFYRGAFTQITLPGIQGTDTLDVYRVTSDYIADIEGQWEVPDKWPDENTYSAAPGADPLPDNGAYQQLRRVHELARLHENGNLEIIRGFGQDSDPLKPFDDSLTLFGTGYARDFVFRQQSTPSTASKFYQDYVQLDFADLFNAAKQRFDGLTEAS